MPILCRCAWGSASLALASLLVASGAESPAPQSQPADPVAAQALGIIGTKHDFTDGGAAERGLCLPCHTPHITSRDAPLLTPVGRTVRPFPGTDVELDQTSLLCLSCHDGLLARDVFAGSHASTGLTPPEAGRPARGLTNHPVGVRYPSGEDGYQPLSFVQAPGGVELRDGRIQCVTCHDPHNSARRPGMLVASNERSRLCLTCHRL